ncbi:MAG: TadE/TadG family type IV pilus assembly protein [Eggerthella lenta]
MRRTCESGQATVEAAFLLPVLFVGLLLLMQPGILLYDRLVMQAAASEGCRLLATKTAAAGDMAESCEAFVRHRLGAIPPVSCFHVHEGACSWDIRFEGDERSDVVRVPSRTRSPAAMLMQACAARHRERQRQPRSAGDGGAADAAVVGALVRCGRRPGGMDRGVGVMMFDAFHDEEGMTTVGVVLSLLVTLALVFSAGQAYRVGSASSEVQNVADAAALAAQNEVGEFMIAVRVCVRRCCRFR